MRRIKIIGLTGQSGAGKSTAADFFSKKGFAVINADLLVRQLYENKSPCVLSIAAQFGNDILDSNNQIIRPLLAQRAFSSKENTQLLNSIVHPFVTALFIDKVHNAYNNNFTTVVYDAPQLFESKTDIICDEVISIIASKETRINRICRRDNITREAAEQRINAQLDEEFFKKNSSLIIQNNDALNELYKQLEYAYDEIC